MTLRHPMNTKQYAKSDAAQEHCIELATALQQWFNKRSPGDSLCLTVSKKSVGHFNYIIKSLPSDKNPKLMIRKFKALIIN